MNKYLACILYILTIKMGCVSISWFGSSDSNRPYDATKQIHTKIENPEVFGDMLKFLENKNDSKYKTEFTDESDRDSVKTISNYLGSEVGKIIIHIANMASLQSEKSENYQDYNLKVNPNSILEHIATVLESQGEGFDYEKIKESIYKWASFYLQDDQNSKFMKSGNSSHRVSS